MEGGKERERKEVEEERVGEGGASRSGLLTGGP